MNAFETKEELISFWHRMRIYEGTIESIAIEETDMYEYYKGEDIKVSGILFDWAHDALKVN